MATATKAKPKTAKPQVTVTVAKFDLGGEEVYRPIRSGVSIGKWQPITRGDYNPRGSTPLRDATAKFIAHLAEQAGKGKVTIGCLADESGSMSGNEESVVAGINEFVAGMADVSDIDPENDGQVLAVILTDGMENASNEVNQEQLQQMIAQRESEGWTFIYLGANQDAWVVGRTMGSTGAESSSYNYVSSPLGTSSAFSAATCDSASWLSNKEERLTRKAGVLTNASISELGDVIGNSPAASKEAPTEGSAYDIASALAKAKEATE
jgi:hypothetical protein